MANTITASIYSYQANPDFTDGYGVQMGFPVEGVVIRDLPTPVVYQGINCNATIEVISDSDPFPTYFAAETAAQLIADANSGTTPSPDPTPISFPTTSTDAFGRLRVSEPLTLFDSSHRFDDNDLWATATATGGTAVFNSAQGLVDLNVTAASGSSVTRETIKVFAYQPGKSLLVMNTFVMNICLLTVMNTFVLNICLQRVMNTFVLNICLQMVKNTLVLNICLQTVMNTVLE